MAGTHEGGLKAAEKNKADNKNFYREIGGIGGKISKGGGFAARPELAREAGRKGGKASRRKKVEKTTEPVAIPVNSMRQERLKARREEIVIKNQPVATELPKPIDVSMPRLPTVEEASIMARLIKHLFRLS